MEYFREHLQTRFEFNGAPARDVIWEYPLEALREAVTNAVCHRDYLDLSQTQIRWHDDRILVVNPGKLIPPLNPQALLLPHVSLQRNHKIAEMLYYAGQVESWGSGTLKMRRSCLEAGLPEPQFSEEQGAIWVSFPSNPEQYGSVEKGSQKSTVKMSVKMSEKMSEKILAFIVTRRFTNAVKIAREIGVTSRTVERALAKLRTSGKIKRVGPDKGGHWEVL